MRRRATVLIAAILMILTSANLVLIAQNLGSAPRST